MSPTEKIKVKIKSPGPLEVDTDKVHETVETIKTPEVSEVSEKTISFGTRLNDLALRPRRNPVIHWVALILSLVSLIPLIIWIVNPLPALSSNWYGLDIWFSVFFAVEFFTRSGFRWNPAGYIRTRFFDFIAIVPALVLVHYNVPSQSIWVWIILVARIIRATDRVLGDGFLTRNALAIADGFLEEVTDRVLLRIMDRIQNDLDRGKFGNAVGEVLRSNKPAVLRKVRLEHPHIVETGLAHIVGIDTALERAEEQVYDAVVTVLESPEVDTTIRQAVDSTFTTTCKEIAQKQWVKNLGFRRITRYPPKTS